MKRIPLLVLLCIFCLACGRSRPEFTGLPDGWSRGRNEECRSKLGALCATSPDGTKLSAALVPETENPFRGMWRCVLLYRQQVYVKGIIGEVKVDGPEAWEMIRNGETELHSANSWSSSTGSSRGTDFKRDEYHVKMLGNAGMDEFWMSVARVRHNPERFVIASRELAKAEPGAMRAVERELVALVKDVDIRAR